MAYLLGGVLMVAGGLVQAWLGIDCQRRSLENVAPPLCQAPAAHQAGDGKRHA